MPSERLFSKAGEVVAARRSNIQCGHDSLFKQEPRVTVVFFFGTVH